MAPGSRLSPAVDHAARWARRDDLRQVMRRLQPAYVNLCLLVLLLTACRTPPPRWHSDLHRAKTFEALATTNHDAWQSSSSLKRRTAILIKGSRMTPVTAKGSTVEMRLVPEIDGTVWWGHAVGLACDGYFLTSAHCAESTILSLIYWDGQTARVATPRIVARLSHSDHLLDSVLLHVDAIIPETFEWAAEIDVQKGERVLGVGSTSIAWKDSSRGFIQLTCTAGHIASSRRSADNGITIFGDLPSRDGDSGGPVTTAAGKLLGVHAGTEVNRLAATRSVALRPDLLRLEQLIARDRASHQNGTVAQPPSLVETNKTYNLTIRLF